MPRPGAEPETPVHNEGLVVLEEEGDDDDDDDGEEAADSFPVPGERRRNSSFSQQVREWGANKHEEGGGTSLLPPKRFVTSLQGGARLRSSLLTVPESTETVPTDRQLSGALFNRGPPPTSILRHGHGASTIQGKTMVRLSVLPVAKHKYRSRTASRIDDRILSFAPKRLLDIENGKSILVSDQQFLSEGRFQEIGQDGALIVTARATAPLAKEDAAFFEQRGSSLMDKIQSGDVRDFTVNSEVGFFGGAWRGVLKRLILSQFDEVNSLRLTRPLQAFMPFATGYEAYIIGQLIEGMDSGRKRDIKYTLNIAFQNRNISRILLRLMFPRYDFLWHSSTAVKWNRVFDAWGRLPIVGISRFAGSENFVGTRDHALASIFRILLGQGNWLTRVFTRGRQGLVTDNPKNVAQNLAAEVTGFELANRNQFGTYIGRRKTNEFRFMHRLPVDESIVRTFVESPAATMLNNGVVHQLRRLAQHWHNMIFQFSGNFAHQRQELLSPFETLRFHIPVVLMTLSTLRGRNKWDSQVLGPMIEKLQQLKPAWTADAARYLVAELKDSIVIPVSGGVASIVDPFMSWLDAIHQVCTLVEAEAKEVYEIVTSVEIGIRLGHDLISQVSWKIPTEAALKKAILNHIRGLSTGDVKESRIRSALTLVTPRDKRTLIELIKNGLANTKPAQLLLGRAKTLLQRELRREILNEAIRELSQGEYVTEMEHDEWYWLEKGDKMAAYIYDAKVTGRDQHRFIHVDTKFEEFVSIEDGSVKFRAYVPVAEAITRAQKAFMTIELDHLKKFPYPSFMEFTFLRVPLRRMMILAQIHCEELDNARLNVLAEIQRSNQSQVSIHDMKIGQTYYTYDSKQKVYVPFVCEKEYTATDVEWPMLARSKIVNVPPQSMIVIGGGPTGLTTVVHCTENVLVSGGVMKLYEARDAFTKGGSTFERAQIVRLDSRWIAMLRYHLGTGYEDVYIPASGETASQLGNILPGQGFVEITIKDLENMLHVEMSKMWAKGLIQVHTDSMSKYDHVTNSLTKFGEHLKVDDGILRRVDENGMRVNRHHSWKVVDIVYTQALAVEELTIGMEYGVYNRLDNAVFPYRLTGVDLDSMIYTFKALEEGKEDLKANSSNLPSVYPKGVTRHAEASKIVIESVVKGRDGGYVRDELLMKVIKKEKFTIDVGHTHVIECTGKPAHSDAHFLITTYEPYGVCCIQGLKVSMGMHNFGETRWGNGLLDDFRSTNDQNTRIVGDFTKMVKSAPIAARMHEYMTNKKDTNWQAHFNALVAESQFPDLNTMDPVVPKIQQACKDLAERADSFRRQSLQTRFFETGDNYYLGMEFTREYDRWKIALTEELVAPLSLKAKDDTIKSNIGRLKGAFNHHIDRLWYDACLETIRKGDVYHPGARGRIPRLYLINSYSDQQLGGLPVGESFRLSDRPSEKYEVVAKKATQVIARNVEGYITRMANSTLVKREGNLTRGPDGNAESRVSLATFPVGHYVNFRTLRLNDSQKGYIFAFIGDEQSTPHFMRYSGLTGACINSMLINNFVKQANQGVPFIDRFKLYSFETNWSNGEVVTRGTGSNYGRDGFLRPGFHYKHGMDYMHSKIIETRESGQDMDKVMSRDWLAKMAASMVPRGMELNENFIGSLYGQLRELVFEKFVNEAKSDKEIGNEALVAILKARYGVMHEQRSSLDYNKFWNEYVEGLVLPDTTRSVLDNEYIFVAKRMDQLCNQIIEFAAKAHLYDERITAELHRQPKPVDSIVDDFAVEAQNFANALTMSAAISSGVLAFGLLGRSVGRVFSTLLAALNILLSFGTMANSSRYKIRNEEARIIFQDEKMQKVRKTVFSIMDSSSMKSVPENENPFVEDLEKQVDIFLKSAEYYDFPDPKEFLEAFAELKKDVVNPEAIRAFQVLLTSKFIVDTYHVSSYIQEYLVNIYKTCEEMHYLLTTQLDRNVGASEAKALFDRLGRFHHRLEGTLQRGPTRWGFVKQRRFTQWDISAFVGHFYGLFCVSSRTKTTPGAPVSTETLGIVKQARHLSGLHGSLILRREIRDLEGLFWATRESANGSLIFMAGFFVFCASVLFTIARIFRIEILVDVAFWASLPSSYGAALVSFHWVRKFWLLLGLQGVLGKKIKSSTSTDSADSFRRVRRITWTQIFLVVTRLFASLAAAVALPWSIAERQFGGFISLNPNIPFWVALGAVSAAFGATLFFFVVEYVVRYNLDPTLASVICETFRGELENMFNVLERPLNDIDTKQEQDRETWEYVAREFLHRYRFDTVFAADRFGSILQYIQSGMEPRIQ
jgi:hypothetical protein